MDVIAIPVPAELLDDPEADVDLVEHFSGFIDDELAPALDTDVWEIDDRANTYEVEIENVELQGDDVIVHYNVLFDAYYGCRDMNYAGQDERHVFGKREGDVWIFAPYIRRERRSTADEL